MAALSRLQKAQRQPEKQTQHVESQKKSLADLEVKQALLRADIEATRIRKTELELRVFNLLRAPLADPYSAPPGLDRFEPEEHQGQLGEAFQVMTRGKGKGEMDSTTFLQGVHYMCQYLQPQLLEGLHVQMGTFAAQIRTAG
eukprot:8858166-Pyramimonas_sp.AAC.1